MPNSTRKTGSAGVTGSQPTGVIYFPVMHSELVSGEVPEAVRFLDPGLLRDVPEGFWRPDNLPISPAAAKRYVAESLRFGEQFRDPEELKYFSAAKINDFYSDSSMAIRSDLARRNRPTPSKPAASLYNAQEVLLLGWTLEERLLEMQQLEAQLNSSQSTFASILGLDAEDDLQEQSVLKENLRGSFDPSRELERAKERLLESFCTFLPEQWWLFSRDADFAKILEEAGTRHSAPQGVLETPSALVEYRVSLPLKTDRDGNAGKSSLGRTCRILIPEGL